MDKPSRSMLPFAPPPLDFNPFADIEHELADGRAIIEREIEELREILSRPPRGSRLRPDPAARPEDDRVFP
jgi:hypothetical protein